MRERLRRAMFMGALAPLAFSLAGALLAAEYNATRAELIPAFPGAEGAGAFTPGGRGGRVFVVTNLNDAGPSSLREAVEASGPRTVVFGTAGIITLESPLTILHPFITIAGQTAPGDGICIRGETVEVNTHDVILRYLRFRRGNLVSRNDSLGGYPIGNIIVDHVSASWGLDENLSLYRSTKPIPNSRKKEKLPVTNLTIQWSISSEALDPNNHAFGGTWGGDGCSFHHNLFACNTGRNPSIGTGGTFDFRNNVLFNWRHRTIDGGDGTSRINLVANYFKPGPATTAKELRYRICKCQARAPWYEHPGMGLWHVEDNWVEGEPGITADNWSGGVQFEPTEKVKWAVVRMGTQEEVRAYEPFPAAPITEHSAREAYELVLAQAGASLPRRDAVDERVTQLVRSGKPSYRSGIIETPDDVGGYPEYRASQVPSDRDVDGLPDGWEMVHGLNPEKSSDAVADDDRDGYTNIEEFLNGTDPAKFVDYTKPENNQNDLHDQAKAPGL